jgi:CRP-like cAMP-binding protein
MLSPMERIIHLKKIPLFSELQARELTAIASIVEERTLPPETIIIQEGDEGERLYLILKGKVSVIKNMGTPKEIHLADIGQDDYFGEIALFDNQPRSATVLTREETHVLEVSRFEFEELMKAFPKIAIHACTEFSQRIRELQQKIQSASDPAHGSS